MKKEKKASDTAPDPYGNQSRGRVEERAERTKGAGSHGDARAGDEGIDEPGGPLPNEFPPQEDTNPNS